MVTTRDGYASAPVGDGHALLDEPGFWAAHLAGLAGDFPAEAFGTDRAEAADALELLEDPASWPVFRVPLDGGGAVLVHRNNGEEHSSTDCFLELPDSGSGGRTWTVLTSDDQDRLGPGLCWPELDAVRHPPELPREPEGASGVLDPHDRLLLLLPLLGDTEAPATPAAVAAVTGALAARGAPEQGREDLARQLLGGHPMWGAAPWTYDAEAGSWICAGPHSPRAEPLGAFLAWRRHLVQHDYGMGAMLWWMWAPSAREIVETYAEVEVVAGAGDRADGLEEVTVDDPGTDSALPAFREQRAAQRGRPGYGALAGRERVWIRHREEDEDGAEVTDPTWLLELGPDGRWLRQVEVAADGTGVRSVAEEWPINPPVDLRDPALAGKEIPYGAFEEAWRTARPET